jgi:hypothetical protein
MTMCEVLAEKQDTLSTYRVEAAQYRLARDAGWRQASLGRFVQILALVLAALGLAGK